MRLPPNDLLLTVYLALWNAAGQLDPDDQQAKLCELIRAADEGTDGQKYTAQLFIDQELDEIS